MNVGEQPVNVETSMRDRIIAATAGLLVENGTHSSMAQIAREAGVATGSLYNHFRNKDELLFAVYESLGDEMRAALVRAEPAADACARLTDYVEDYIDFIWINPERAILFEYLSNVPLVPGQSLIDAFQSCSLYIFEIMERLIADGRIPAGDSAMMGAFIGGAIRNTLKWHRASGRELTAANRAQIVAMCRQGVGLVA
jgi:AcrR family transcriptional regulator